MVSMDTWWHLGVLGVLTLSGFVADADLTSLVAGAAAVAVLVVAMILASRRPVGDVRPLRMQTAVRDRRHRAAYVQQCDPHAPGRPRPRAPDSLCHR